MAVAPRTRLLHPGSGRQALIVVRHDWLDSPPVQLRGRRYALLAAHQRKRPDVTATAARRWIDAGASYICARGPSAQETEDAFDHASFIEDHGLPLSFTLMTTAHDQESLEETLWFAFYNALHPSELPEPLDTVVIVVDKPALAVVCETWIRSNRE